MLPQATQHHYETLRKELWRNNKPGVWAGHMQARLEDVNPEIGRFTGELLELFGSRPWFPHMAHCAFAVYRLLEIAGDLPVVRQEVGAPMQVEMRRDFKKLHAAWVGRLQTENPRVISVLADYGLECLGHNLEQGARCVMVAGISVYQYLARQDEANELARLPLK